MSVEQCKAALDRTAAEVELVLEPLGFRFQHAHAAQGHQAFASGHFATIGPRVRWQPMAETSSMRCAPISPG